MSTRKDTKICEFALHGFMYRSIYDIIYDNICIFVNMCTYSKRF